MTIVSEDSEDVEIKPCVLAALITIVLHLSVFVTLCFHIFYFFSITTGPIQAAKLAQSIFEWIYNKEPRFSRKGDKFWVKFKVSLCDSRILSQLRDTYACNQKRVKILLYRNLSNLYKKVYFNKDAPTAALMGDLCFF